MSNCSMSAIIYREASERKSLKYFSTVQSCTFNLELKQAFLSKVFSVLTYCLMKYCIYFMIFCNMLSLKTFFRVNLNHET